jgi:hypothetical protein
MASKEFATCSLLERRIEGLRMLNDRFMMEIISMIIMLCWNRSSKKLRDPSAMMWSKSGCDLTPVQKINMSVERDPFNVGHEFCPP